MELIACWIRSGGKSLNVPVWWDHADERQVEVISEEYFLKYFKQNLSWSNSRKVCSEVLAMMTFGSHTGGNMEWGFGDHLPTPKVDL